MLSKAKTQEDQASEQAKQADEQAQKDAAAQQAATAEAKAAAKPKVKRPSESLEFREMTDEQLEQYRSQIAENTKGKSTSPGGLASLVKAVTVDIESQKQMLESGEVEYYTPLTLNQTDQEPLRLRDAERSGIAKAQFVEESVKKSASWWSGWSPAPAITAASVKAKEDYAKLLESKTAAPAPAVPRKP